MRYSRRAWAGGLFAALFLSAFVLASPSGALFGQQPGMVPAEAEKPEPLPPPAPGELRPEVLTRGPVHEAYAAPTPLNPLPGQIVKKAPPPLVNELPPDQKPEGDNVKWVPGYWAFEEDRKDYIWISGFWRQLPPGRQWIAGYWNKTESGDHQWIAGYWARLDQPETQYLPQPPQTLEIGPSTPEPGEDYLWTPGSWIYETNRYLWRPGCWTNWQAGWVYTPTYYSFTPCGYVCVDGFWDFSLPRRGLLFAPCAFGPSAFVGWGGGWGFGGGWGWGGGWGVGLGLGWFRPSVCLNTNLFASCLWTRPWGGYCFGNYWGGGRGWGSWGGGWGGGCRPWWNAGRNNWCPLYNYNSCYYRNRNPNWAGDLRRGYADRAANPALRPANTFRDQQRLAGGDRPGGRPDGGPRIGRGDSQLGQPLNQVARAANANPGNGPRLQPVSAEQRKAINQQSAGARQAFSERARIETAAARERPASQARPSIQARGGDRQPAVAGGTLRAENAGGKPLTLTRPNSPLAGRPSISMPNARGQAPREVQPAAPRMNLAERGQPSIRQPAAGQPSIRSPGPQVGSAERAIRPGFGGGSVSRPGASAEFGSRSPGVISAGDRPARPYLSNDRALGRTPSLSGRDLSGGQAYRSAPSMSGNPSYRSSPAISGNPSYRSSPSVGGSPSIRLAPSYGGSFMPPSGGRSYGSPSFGGSPSYRSAPSFGGGSFGGSNYRSGPSPSFGGSRGGGAPSIRSGGGGGSSGGGSRSGGGRGGRG